jgi:hypothetical protein
MMRPERGDPKPLNGRMLSQVAGWLGFGWNFPRNQIWTSLGYPAGPPFNGQRMFQDTAPYELARPWTDEEMAAAKPLPLPTVDSAAKIRTPGVPHTGKGETKPPGRPDPD